MSNQPEKIAMIYSLRPSEWVSCQSIVHNLKKAYTSIYGESLTHINFNTKHEPMDIHEIAEQIYQLAPDKLLFIDHKPIPSELLITLKKEFYKKKDLPEIVMHIFGDFSIYGKEWLRINEVIKDVPVKLICASEKQQDLVEQFISQGINYISYSPFPVDESVFCYDAELRKKARAEHLDNTDDYIFLYTGRVSLQKNIQALIREFSQFLERTDAKARLLIAGVVDDLGAPFFNIHHPAGYYGQTLSTQLNALPAKTRSQISYIGNLTHDELKEYYMASDCFISLSMHNDEDYGMSPAEALCCGQPCILTDWAGYYSFKRDEIEATDLITTSITSKGLEYDSKETQKLLEKNYQRSFLDDSARKKISNYYIKNFSIAAATKRLKSINEATAHEFAGFKWKMSMMQNGPTFPAGPVQNSIYEEIYEKYTTR